MYSIKKLGRVTGVLLIIQMAIGMLINISLLGPLIFTSDFITKISENTNQVLISILLIIIIKTIGVGVAIMLFSVFKKLHRGFALWYLCLSVILFVIGILDNAIILSLVSFSEEYFKQGVNNTNNLEAIGSILKGTRGWVHMMDLLVSSISLSIFYYLMYMSKFVPRILSILCFFAAILIFINVLLAFFGTGSMYLYMPMAISQLMFLVWLIIKGFNGTYKLQEAV
ncbi:DUF4386 domain-containing protein [uncultured Aquimarina sp.]|uniref:DUF4386 domain-containing protein n=1 Tax=uncultured Aquimarina sp. TaxID=575652 RepID=UPI002606F3AD|nr:DUF4386 domain-containing protein [uncultured Aquimarina sp.]